MPGGIIQLSKEQVASLSTELDIIMFVSGMDVTGEDPDYFTIDIQNAPHPPIVGTSNSSNQISIHDGENWIMGKTANLEYSTDEGESWTAYVHGETRFDGDQTILVRYAANSVYLTSGSTELTFTENDSAAFKHIPVSEVELVSASDNSYYGGQTGANALDANPFTGWHSAAYTSKDIIVSFSEAKSLAGLTYISSASGANGRIRDLEVYVSMDIGVDESTDEETDESTDESTDAGVDDIKWVKVGSVEGWANDHTLKTLKLEHSVTAKYVKLVATYTFGNGNEGPNKYVSGVDIDFYEDTTTEAEPISVLYSTVKPTQNNVTADLMLPAGYTAVGETTHIFTENGSHSFRYTDEAGASYTVTAKVDWIDRTPPTVTVEYSTTEITNGSVTATVKADEDIIVTNNDGSASYTFTDNGSFTFELTDAAGNAAVITAKVNWISPIAGNYVSFSFSGENAGKLIFNSFYENLAIDVSYSLDGGMTQNTVHFDAEDTKVLILTPEQLAELADIADSSGEIVVTITTDTITSVVQTIDLETGAAAPTVGAADRSTQINIHDGENWIMGKTENLEYSTDGIHWAAYDHSTTRFTGDQTVQVRYMGNGLTRPSAVTELIFTENDSPEFTHISVSEVTLIRDNNSGYYNNRPGGLAVDANPFTSWHSAAGVTEENKQLVVKFSEEKWLSGITYQAEGTNGRFSGVTVYVSDDGEAWKEAGSAAGWGSNDTSLKTVQLEKSVKATYVKLLATTHNTYISARDIDFYEDTTGMAGAIKLSYSTTDFTNEDVKATLWVDEDISAEVTEHVFKENGEYTFHYTDRFGNPQSIIAAVTWIDKTAPAATVTYSTMEKIQGSVIATITPNEEVTVTNNNGSLSYTFIENGSFEFQIVDKAGNTAAVKAKVTWVIPALQNHVSFSFDGENAGKIIIGEAFADYDQGFEYSIDQGATWADGGNELVITVAPEDINRMTAANDLRIRIKGQDEAATIDIQKSERITSTYVFVDQEEDNLVCNNVDTEKIVEYSRDNINWLPYDKDARFPGAVRVYVRFGNHGVYLAGDANWFTMTADSRPADFKYIKNNQLEFVSCGSYEEGKNPEYAIDVNSFTGWHTKYETDTEDKSYVVSLKSPVYLAGIEYTPEASTNGRIKNVEVYVSSDNAVWTKAGEASNWRNNTDVKQLKFANAVYAKYVKIVAVNTYGNAATDYDRYVSAKEFKFFEDTTVRAVVNGIPYSSLDDAFAATENEEHDEIILVKQEGTTLAQAIQLQASKDDALKLTILTDDGKVTFDKAAAGTILGNMDESQEISLNVTNVTDQEDKHIEGAAATYEITLEQGDKNLFPEKEDGSGNAVVMVKAPESIRNKGFAVYHVDGNKKTRVEGAEKKMVDGIDYVVFTTTHFSLYTIEVIDTEEETKTEFTGINAVLTDQIGLNFYFTLADGIEKTDVQVKIQLPGKNTPDTFSGDALTEENGYYCVNVSLNAKEMTEQIEAQLWISGAAEAAASKSISVRDYLNIIRNEKNENDSYVYSGNARKLAEATLNYGGYAQVYLGYKEDDLANKDADFDTSLTTVTLGSIETALKTVNNSETGIKPSYKDNLSGITYYGTSTLMQGQTVLRHYFIFDAAEIKNYQLSAEGAAFVQREDAEKYYYVDMSGISPDKMGITCPLTITNTEEAGKELTVKYSIYGYLYEIIENERDGQTVYSEKMTNLAKAMFLYGEAARAYAAELNASETQ